ncbi:bifunctional diguanylate cyclase/phosphodiesterase [Asticcacaulis sp. BYS171W]|uniref:Bifunctional diguanylate cyclase/phosphodiesterase n=1 Tax=Asticcacaulis aquaticus TaxID=2984212 RepID=A0ABT5HWY9_9CAUL|nr:bifunctional diguanylate cyclase/phosphodiesterase [Asticcacaulis aquaticus]MDC7684601.1 bifunctional diguanylate cyclase/phosphodiesterase [Asticcacaulis aquaticus]
MASATHDTHLLTAQIRADQLATVRRSVKISIPINIVLSLIIMTVTVYYGHAQSGVLWFATALLINMVRVALCQAPFPGTAAKGAFAGMAKLSVDRHLFIASLAALTSGSVWALMPALCEGYTSAQSGFYLVVICGITAGAVVHGNAYAIIPICFIVPPLMSMAGCLFYAGGFDRIGLACATLLYLGALIRSALESEVMFRYGSQRKNEATTLAGSLKQAHARTTEVAEEMRHRAVHDALTGLLNRSGFAAEVERRVLDNAQPLCLMILDLDGFKSVNDVFGHRAGDDVLVEVARRLKTIARDGFTIARLGGDEFAVLFDADAAPADEIAGRIITAIGQPFDGFDAGRVGVSIGIHHPRDRVSFSEMMVCADTALYAAKNGGRNRFHHFDATLSDRLDMKRDIERDLPRALTEHQLHMWYQPIFSNGGRTFSHFEALLRWEHDKHGWVSPVDIVENAAVLGLSEPLLKYILAEACAMTARLKASGLDKSWIAVNISPREMSRLPVETMVFEALKQAGVSPSMIEIEITEETAMDMRAVEGKLAVLAEGGIRLAIDDFGVGYSSLSSLRHLRVDRLKIDKSFVIGLTDSTSAQVMVQAIVNLGHSLGMEVVAEGVENAETQALLQRFGCRNMQGYHLGRPMSKDAAIEWATKKPTDILPAGQVA